VAQHVGIGSVSQGAISLACFDAAAQFVGFVCCPDGLEVVVVFAQVAHRLGANTACPHVAIGRDLRRGHTGQAGNNLPLLDQGALHDVVVAIAERLGLSLLHL